MSAKTAAMLLFVALVAAAALALYLNEELFSNFMKFFGGPKREAKWRPMRKQLLGKNKHKKREKALMVGAKEPPKESRSDRLKREKKEQKRESFSSLQAYLDDIIDRMPSHYDVKRFLADRGYDYDKWSSNGYAQDKYQDKFDRDDYYNSDEEDEENKQEERQRRYEERLEEEKWERQLQDERNAEFFDKYTHIWGDNMDWAEEPPNYDDPESMRAAHERREAEPEKSSEKKIKTPEQVEKLRKKKQELRQKKAAEKKAAEEFKGKKIEEPVKAEGPAREAAVKHHVLTEAKDNDPKAKYAITVLSKDAKIGYACKVNLGEKKDPHYYVVFPKHFLDYGHVKLQFNKEIIEVHKAQMSPHYDLAWIPCDTPKLKSFAPVAPFDPDVKVGNVATQLLVFREGKWFWSFTDTVKTPEKEVLDGELIYMAPTVEGDCGAIVWQNNMAVGIHVGTLGPNKGNKFLPLVVAKATICRI